jgi:hypothetical protein
MAFDLVTFVDESIVEGRELRERALAAFAVELRLLANGISNRVKGEATRNKGSIASEMTR